MGKFILACLVGLLLATSHARAAVDDEEDDDEYVGTVLVLMPAANTEAELPSNVSGLVVLIVPQPGGKPVADLKVEAPKTFKKAGVLKGVPVRAGHEHICHLFEPTKEGKATVKISYTDGDGKKVEESYKIAVAPEPEEKE